MEDFALHAGLTIALAQRGDPDAVWSVVLWAVVLIAAVLVMGVVLMKLRRKLREEDEEIGDGLLLDDLRRLRDSGQLSSEEYQRAVAAMAGRMGAAGSSAGPSSSAE